MPEEPVPLYALVAGGGTAGHVLPGLAVAEALVARGHPRASIRFVGSERGLETRVVPEAGFPFTPLAGRGIERRPSLESARAAVNLVRGVAQGVALVRRLRPRVVVVLGGFASVPCAVGAKLAGVPVVVTEQNARAGAASRLAGHFAAAAAVPFAETDLPRKVVTGNPVRPEILAVDREHGRAAARSALGLPEDRTVVAVFTGSLGARRVNLAVRGAIERGAADSGTGAGWADRSDLAVRHVIGVRDWDELGSPPELPDGGLVYQPVRYEDRMDLVLAAADLAVCRAGGTTVAELAEVGLPAVLVPLPGAPRDHQTANAAALAAAGAARLVADADLDADRLVAEVDALLADGGTLAAMGAAGRALAQPDAADKVAALVEEHARRG